MFLLDISILKYYIPITSQSRCSRSVNFREVVDGTSDNKFTGFCGLFMVEIPSPLPISSFLIFWIGIFCAGFPPSKDSFNLFDGGLSFDVVLAEFADAEEADGRILDSQLLALITPSAEGTFGPDC